MFRAFGVIFILTLAEMLTLIVASTGRSDLRRAIADYTRAVELNPNLADAYGNRGILLYNLGNKQRAIADLQRAADLFKQ